MLEPNNRQLFLTSLRPPEGYELDALTGTTFSLDLDALLSVPLSLTLFGADYQMDASALMMAIRRYADVMTIYCQQGEMQSARQHSLLYSYLESVVVEMTAPTPNRVFHPKVWVLRYKHPEKPLLYRLLCMSRNLTYDRSWDTVVMLDGSAGDSVVAENQALVDFLNFLAQQPGSKRHTGDLADEIRTVRFEPPAPFQRLNFYVLGLEANRDRFADIFQNWKRLLVISPFIEPNLLARLARTGKNHVLVSRADELDCLAANQITPYRSIFTLVDTANPETTDDDPNYLSGLHAKLYLADTGDSIHLWTGSANATNAAFNGNVEFLVELVKPRNGYDGFTIEKLIQSGPPNDLNFRSLLAEYHPSDVPVEPDKAAKDLENRLEAAKANIIGAAFSAVYEAVSESLYHLTLNSKYPVNLGDVRPGWNPVTIQGSFMPGEPIPCSLEAVTPFFVFSLSARHETAGITRTIRFVLKLPISGADLEARDRAIVQKVVGNRQGVLRYLLMLLGDLDNQQMNIFDNLERLLKNGAAGGIEGMAAGLPLFETMVRALVQQPDRLDEIERFIRDVDTTLLPEHFLAIWQPVWDTYVQSRTRP